MSAFIIQAKVQLITLFEGGSGSWPSFGWRRRACAYCEPIDHRYRGPAELLLKRRGRGRQNEWPDFAANRHTFTPCMSNTKPYPLRDARVGMRPGYIMCFFNSPFSSYCVIFMSVKLTPYSCYVALVKLYRPPTQGKLSNRFISNYSESFDVLSHCNIWPLCKCLSQKNDHVLDGLKVLGCLAIWRNVKCGI